MSPKLILAAGLLLAVPAFAGSSAEELKNRLGTIKPEVSADDQWDAYQAAAESLCDSTTGPEAVTPKPGDAKASAEHIAYLDQLILLTDRLDEVDSGKRAMDCFGGYYDEHKKDVESRLKLQPADVRARVREDLKAYEHQSRDSKKPRAPQSAKAKPSPAKATAADPGHSSTPESPPSPQ